MFDPRDLPEPAENVVFLVTMPMLAVLSFAAVFAVNIGSLAILPFACCAESIGNAGSAAAASIAGMAARGREAAAGAFGSRRAPPAE